MKKINILLLVISFYSFSLQAQPGTKVPPAKVDYDTFEKLTQEVKKHRKTRLINLDKFLEMSKKDNVIILDTRSDAMYAAKHIKGAVHLSFPDFTQDNLAKIIPSFDTKILIYCNNNFEGDKKFFATKAVVPTTTKKAKSKPITLALNIPTYINLYGYGYKNVYELFEYVSVFDSRIQFEGTTIATQIK